MPNTGAYVEEHNYSSGRRFFTVRCDDHDSPWDLNSGHHYRDTELHLAEELVAIHNADYHGTGE